MTTTMVITMIVVCNNDSADAKDQALIVQKYLETEVSPMIHNDKVAEITNITVTPILQGV